MRRLKRIGIVITLLIVSFFIYVLIMNRNSEKMTGRQKLLKAVYPIWIGITQMIGKNTSVLYNKQSAAPLQNIYDLSVVLNNGQVMPLSTWKGKKILLVNTASDCGYTNQYEDLQELYERFQDKLVIIGFPANDFKEQEKGTDADIAEFCKVNFGVSFPLSTKSTVIKGAEQNKVFQWLTHADQNGWNEKEPSWNFSKYLVNEEGVLTHYFDPSVSPMGAEVLKAITRQ